MATVKLKGNPAETSGNLPRPGSAAPAFELAKSDLSNARLADFSGETLVLNIFPSIDTPVCAASVRRFNEEAGNRNNVAVLCISMDLPFAHARFCEVEGLKNVTPLSAFRSPAFGKDYGLTITTGPLAGLLARAVIILDPKGRIIYSELVPEITQEPDYKAALNVLP
ncbi:MAG TPA: thiol peroxidase [Kiritimatiellia bacterium]|nr:thiol peroxidase [Kiritimatiellia bacterium]HNR93581.1 thiol peroxidase [Kiritimatiellia bacterium]HNS80739.1 thiol peroxidase [Kiritimatiellia bacterium]